jgi:host factor-I protein
MKSTINFQDSFLTQARKGRIPLVVFLVNGFQLRGVLTGFDNFVILLQSDGKQQMIYKHAVSTIVPEQPISFREES